MRLAPRIFLYVVFLVIIVVLTFFVLSVIRMKKYERGYSRLRSGDSQQTVIELFGTPSEVKQCADNIWWDKQVLKHNNGECKEEYLYSAPAMIEFWTIGFDENKKVISKYHGGLS